MPSPADRHAAEVAVTRAHTTEWAYVLAATARVAGDLDVAEDCVQDAYAQALVHWTRRGVPDRPGAWLTTVATRGALQHRRRAATLARKLPLLVPDPVEEVEAAYEAGEVERVFPDDRLRLVFTCCHPALARETQVALTLRLVCGLSTVEVAKAFLVKETAMQARITRAKRKIADARIPYAIPREHDLRERVDAVLDVVHLVYSSGHTARSGADLSRGDLVARGTDLARMLRTLLPADGEVAGLLALVLLTEARQPARVDAAGRLVLLEDQDRSRWDRSAIAEGTALVEEALAEPPAGRFALMAAIAAVHTEAARWEDTDWQQIAGLYDLLQNRWPSPVVALNRAVAISYAEGPEAALPLVRALLDEPGLATYPYLSATHADLLRRTGEFAEAADRYEEALLLTENEVEAAFLAGRLDEMRRRDSGEGAP